jgi:hypothetical protein
MEHVPRRVRPYLGSLGKLADPFSFCLAAQRRRRAPIRTRASSVNQITLGGWMLPAEDLSQEPILNFTGCPMATDSRAD